MTLSWADRGPDLKGEGASSFAPVEIFLIAKVSIGERWHLPGHRSDGVVLAPQLAGGVLP